MAESPSNEVVLVHLTYLREQMDEVVAHLRRQNGRLDEQGEVLAEHTTKFAVWEERNSSARNTSAKWGAAVSAVVTGVLTALYQVFGGK